MLTLVLASIPLLGPSWSGPAAPFQDDIHTQSCPTRQECLARQRREKAARLQPQDLTRVEKAIRWLESSVLTQQGTEAEKLLQKVAFDPELPELGDIPGTHWGPLHPRAGSLRRGSGPALGGRLWAPQILRTPLDFQLSAAVSIRGAQLYEVQFGEVVRHDDDFFLYADINYRRYADQQFFGIGPDSSRGDRSDFELERVSYGTTLGYQRRSWFGAAVKGEYLQINLNEDDVPEKFDEDSAPGLTSQPDFFRLNAGVWLDYRDVPGNPHSGGLLSVAYSHFNDLGRRDFEFDRWAVDARQFISLGSRQRVLALRLFASSDHVRGNTRVPFYFQRTLGGNRMLRGFRRYRFRDDRLLYLTGEYRWEAAPALELALFYEAGKVFDSRTRFDFTGLEKSLGMGVRFKSATGVRLRLDVGRSREGTHVYLSLGRTF